MSAVSAAIGAGASILSTIGQGAYNGVASKKQYERTRELMDHQNDLNIANWERQNDYQSPFNEMSRLKSAGLNPDLFYSGGIATGQGSINPISGGSVSKSDSINTDMASSILASRQMDIQEKLADSQIAKNYADANQTNELTPWVSKSIQSQIQVNDENAKVLNESVEKVRSETELLRWQSKIEQQSFEIRDAIKDSEISASIANNVSDKKQAEIIEQNFAKLYTAQIKLAVSQAYANYVQSDAAKSNAVTNAKQQQLNAIISHGELSVKRCQYALDKAMSDAGIHNMSLQNEWREMLKSTGVVGEALHGLLSIPGSWFSGVSSFKPR